MKTKPILAAAARAIGAPWRAESEDGEALKLGEYLAAHWDGIPRLDKVPGWDGVARLETFTTPSGHVLGLPRDYCGCITPSGFPFNHGKRCPYRAAKALATSAPASATPSDRSNSAHDCMNALTSAGFTLAKPSPNCRSIAAAALARFSAATLRASARLRSFASVMFAPRVVGRRHRKPGAGDAS